jgi:hypothetical protein
MLLSLGSKLLSLSKRLELAYLSKRLAIYFEIIINFGSRWNKTSSKIRIQCANYTKMFSKTPLNYIDMLTMLIV